MPFLYDLCEEGIFGTNVTYDDLQIKCYEIFGENATFGINKSVECIGDGKGFMSKMGLFNPDWKDTMPEAPQEFVLKLPSSRQTAEREESMRSNGKNVTIFKTDSAKQEYEDCIRKLHNNEVATYELFEETQIKNISFPKVYASLAFENEHSLKGYILMEYIKCAETVYVYDYIQPKEIEEAIRQIARLQAASVNWTEEQKNRLKFRPFVELYPAMLRDKERVAIAMNAFAEKGGESMKEITAKILEITDDFLNYEYFKDIPNQLGIATVFCHGDLWTNNMIWTRDTYEDEQTLLAFVDFQTAYFGNPAVDLIRLLGSCLSGADRRNEWEMLLTIFYEEFKKNLEGIEAPYTFEQLKECYLRFWPLGGMLLVPMMFHGLPNEMSEFSEEGRKKVTATMLNKAELLLEDVLLCNERNQQLKDSV